MTHQANVAVNQQQLADNPTDWANRLRRHDVIIVQNRHMGNEARLQQRAERVPAHSTAQCPPWKCDSACVPR